jgi:hypothetical protein
MRVFVENGIVVCDTNSDWKKLPENEHNFLYECFLLWEWQKGSNKLQWHKKTTTNNKIEYDYLKQMVKNANSNQIEVADEVVDILEGLEAKVNEELLTREKRLEIERLRKRWEVRQREGCYGCNYCEQIGDAWFKCRYSGDELETRFFEKWNPETQCMELFHEMGIPNAHCIDCFNERKEWR